jgi:hypothetical protein
MMMSCFVGNGASLGSTGMAAVEMVVEGRR